MNADAAARHAEIKRLFGGALAHEGAGRDRWLAEQCDDEDLLAEVRTLLAADEETPPPPADTIGGFRIVRVIGEGGMGTVYEAEQERPRRRVALKVLAPFVVGADAESRLRYEAEVLGQLDHPGIAKIHAAGVESGRPWFAMEFIDGVPLDRHAADAGLGARERLALLERICEAVQHAHNRGVVHRDLKPDNILVGPDGAPKLLDFGLAKLVDGEARIATFATRAGEILGTIPYMAPEQVSAEKGAVDPRTDVYALGTIAYELLAGRRPLDLGEKSLTQALASVRDDEAPRLGTLHSRWRGDIETIVAKALEKEQGRRYDSAGDLAADIGRYLKDEPIHARPPTRAYQLKKFVRRNRGLVASLAVIFATLVAGIVVATRERAHAVAERNEARRQKDRADEEAERANREAERAVAERQLAVLKAATANEALDFLVDVFRVEDPFRANDQPASTREVLDRAWTRVKNELGGQPELQTELARALGDIHANLGASDRAIEHYELALAAARRIPDSSRALMQALDLLGPALVVARRFDEAEPVLEEFMERARAGEGGDGALVAAMQKTAGFLLSTNRVKEAEALYREILANEDGATEAERSQHDGARMGLARILRATGRFEESLALLETVCAAAKAKSGAESLAYLNAVSQLSSALLSMRRNEEALALAREVEKAVVPKLDPDDVKAIRVRADVGRCLAACGRHQEAIDLLWDCVERGRRVLGKSDPVVMRTSLAFLDTAVRARNVEGLEPLARELVEILRTGSDADGGYQLGRYLVTLGTVLTYNGKAAEAIAPIAEALAIVRESPGIRSTAGAHTLVFLVRAHLAAGKYAEAVALAEESLALQEALFGRGNMSHVLAAYHLGIIRWRTGEPAKAEPLLTAARRWFLEHRPDAGPLLETLRGLDGVATALGRPDEALAFARERLALAERHCPPDDPKCVAARERVAELTEE